MRDSMYHAKDAAIHSKAAKIPSIIGDINNAIKEGEFEVGGWDIPPEFIKELEDLGYKVETQDDATVYILTSHGSPNNGRRRQNDGRRFSQLQRRHRN